MFHYVPMFFDRSCYDHCRNIPSHDFYKPRTSKDTLLVGSNNTRMAPLIHAIRRVWGCFNVFDVILKQPAVFFDEKTRLITSLPSSDLWWGFNASRLSLAPHMWHIPVQKKKGARLPAKSQNQRPCHSSPTDVLLCRWWSDSLMVYPASFHIKSLTDPHVAVIRPETPCFVDLN